MNGERLRTFGEFHPERWMAQCEEEGDGYVFGVMAKGEARISIENFFRVRKMIPMEPHQIPEVWLLSDVQA